MFSCSIQLSMKFVLLLNLKLLLIVNAFLLNIAEQENFCADKYKNAPQKAHFTRNHFVLFQEEPCLTLSKLVWPSQLSFTTNTG